MFESDYRLLVDSFWGQERFVLVSSDNTLVSMHVFSPNSLGSSIYLGVIKRILVKMDLVFIDIGEEKEGILSFSSLSQKIYLGQKILVQVVREPSGKKGAVLSSVIRLAAFSLILLSSPSGNIYFAKKFVNSSNLRSLVTSRLQTQYSHLSFIVRSSSFSLEDIEKEASFLSAIWDKCLLAYKSHQVGLIYSDRYALLRNEWVKAGIKKLSIVADRMPSTFVRSLNALFWLDTCIEEYTSSLPLFTQELIFWEEIQSLYRRTLSTSSGCEITIDELPELCFIDINSSSSLQSNQYTPYDLNREICSLVAWQIIKRSLSGLIVIDFLRMSSIQERKALVQLFSSFFEEEKEVRFEGISALGLLEMSRVRQTPSLQLIASYLGWSAEIPPDIWIRQIVYEINAHPAQNLILKISPIAYEYLKLYWEDWMEYLRRSAKDCEIKCELMHTNILHYSIKKNREKIPT